MTLAMDDNDLIGRRFDKYELRRFLGRGGMGIVYLAYDVQLEREIAFKILSSNADAERFLREAKTAASLQHSHIVPVYDHDTQDGISYIVMRLLTGGSLDDWLTRNTQLPSPEEVAQLLGDLGSALDYAHHKGVIHRDIKASNVMLDEAGDVFLADFGIAKLLDSTSEITDTGVILGTYRYLAPERWEGKPATPTSDLYALGVLAYKLLTGAMPFDAAEIPALMHQHFFQHPAPVQKFRRELPTALNPVIQTVLAKRPQGRYASARLFTDAFYEAIDGVPRRRTTQTRMVVPPPTDDQWDGPTTPPPNQPLHPIPPPDRPLQERRQEFKQNASWLRRILARRGSALLFALTLILVLGVVWMADIARQMAVVQPPLTGAAAMLTEGAVNRTQTAFAVAALPTTAMPSPTDIETLIPTRTTAPATFRPVTTATTPPLVCPLTPPSRLSVGGMARVIAGQAPNNVREAPSTDADEIGQIPPGQIFTILDGPQCGQPAGRMWWLVAHRDTVGWTTEVVGDMYYLEPVSEVIPTDTPRPPPSAFVTPVTQTISGTLAEEPGLPQQSYVFDWQRGTVIRIEVASLDFDTLLTLQYPDGSLLTDDDSAGELDSRIGPVELPADGRYTIRVETINSRYGDYTLTYTDYSICGHMPIAIVIGEGVRLRSGPSTLDPVLRLARDGECLPVTGRIPNGEWFSVVTTVSPTAWISRSVVEIVGEIDPAVNS